jgi:formylglycine-generating enzyme required for sulfatase activity
MTEKSPDERYQSAEELLVDLDAFRTAHADEDPKKTDLSIGTKRRLMPIVAGVIILGVIALMVALKLGPAREPGELAGGAGAPVIGAAFKVPGVEIDLVPIAAGHFRMGSDTGHVNEKPAHSVHISSPFWMAATETTREQFSAFVEETAARTDAERVGRTMTYETRTGVLGWGWKQNVSWRDFGDHPRQAVVCVSWKDAVAFCTWLTSREHDGGRLPDGYAYRLPTEAEWEYACRAGTTTKYYWGDDPEMYRVYEWCDNTAIQANVVAEFKPNPWGLYDMLGNVMEHCLDFAREGEVNGRTALISDTYRDGITDPFNKTGDQRIRRGGNWLQARRTNVPSSRQALPPEFSSVSVGFRVVLAPSIPWNNKTVHTLEKPGR